MLCSGTSSALSAWVIESPSKLPNTIFVPMTDVGVVQGPPPAEAGAATEAVDTWSDSVTITRKALESGAFWGILGHFARYCQVALASTEATERRAGRECLRSTADSSTLLRYSCRALGLVVGDLYRAVLRPA